MGEKSEVLFDHSTIVDWIWVQNRGVNKEGEDFRRQGSAGIEEQRV